MTDDNWRNDHRYRSSGGSGRGAGVFPDRERYSDEGYPREGSRAQNRPRGQEYDRTHYGQGGHDQGDYGQGGLGYETGGGYGQGYSDRQGYGRGSRESGYGDYDRSRFDTGYNQGYGGGFGQNAGGRFGAGHYGDADRDRYDRERDRNWLNRAGDEMSSWFGDEDAERRRQMDRMRGGHYGRGPQGYSRSDDRIREDVNDRLTDDWRLDASSIEVKVDKAEVTLSGTVDNREDKRRAEDLVENCSGVKHVQNNLRVQPASPTQRAGTTTTARSSTA